MNLVVLVGRWGSVCVSSDFCIASKTVVASIYALFNIQVGVLSVDIIGEILWTVGGSSVGGSGGDSLVEVLSSSWLSCNDWYGLLSKFCLTDGLLWTMHLLYFRYGWLIIK